MTARITDPTSRLLAARIRALRTDREWTLTQLAGQLPIAGPKLTGPLLGRIENGTRAASVPEVGAIADAFGIVPDYLMRAGSICETCGQETTR